MTCPSPHPEVPARSSTFEVLWIKEHTLILSPYIVFTFRFEVESVKEFGGVSFIVSKCMGLTC